MPDLSAIPLGTGVSLFNGLNKNLSYLFDLNQPTYQIQSGPGEWWLLYIRATKSESAGEDEAQWVFTLESDTVANVARIYDRTDPAYDPPRIVDRVGNPVPVNVNETVPNMDTFISASPVTTSWTVPGIMADDYGSISLNITTQVKYRRHTVEEVGTYIMPIAYHQATDAGLDIRQVARSDWAFWPVPMHGIWHRADEIISFSGGTDLPPESP